MTTHDEAEYAAKVNSLGRRAMELVDIVAGNDTPDFMTYSDPQDLHKPNDSTALGQDRFTASMSPEAWIFTAEFGTKIGEEETIEDQVGFINYATFEVPHLTAVTSLNTLWRAPVLQASRDRSLWHASWTVQPAIVLNGIVQGLTQLKGQYVAGQPGWKIQARTSR